MKDLRYALVVFWGILMCNNMILPVFADDSLCAKVKIEIQQELTLERQAFDAHMRINNGLSHITLEDIDIDVSFNDAEGNSVLASSDPNNTEALFFIRLDSMENISNVDGGGIVPPSTSADIHWLIIPAIGASNGLTDGTLYYVGATLTYTIGGEENVTVVSPDFIFVKPMPELSLDYFLPNDVYGDDAFTSEIEPSVPFNLGVRVKNSGAGVARSLKIDSAQPRIVENEQGLLIDFVIQGSEVNGKGATPSLLADFGDIAPNSAGVARWIMTCSLSGEFTEFDATYTHSDDLGGELTSLIESINTHFLVQDVLVDLAGRDSIRDFLALDGGTYRVYESDTTDTVVSNLSNNANLQLISTGANEIRYQLNASVTNGFVYFKLSDPQLNEKRIKEVLRSDGKHIKPENAWLSKTRGDDQVWSYFVNVFDVNTTGTYTITYEDLSAGPQPPVLQFIPDRSGAEGQQMSFVIEASDPNGTTPVLIADSLPPGAGFTDQQNGTAVFDWTPGVGQAGIYEINFKASDGLLADHQYVLIKICSADDSDCDGLDDRWELDHFGTLDRDGTGDYDGDGVSDLDEFNNGTDPTATNAPSVPEISEPEDMGEAASLQPDLIVLNSTDPDGDVITYDFQVYSDETYQDLMAEGIGVEEGIDETAWTVPVELNENTWYFWRVRAGDGGGVSEWAYGRFFVNTANEPPGSMQISRPQDNAEVDTVTPVLEVTNSTDPDRDAVTYGFEVYADQSMAQLAASVTNLVQGGDGATSWTVQPGLQENTWYFFRAIATDEHGANSVSELSSFFVNTANDAPSDPAIHSPAVGADIAETTVALIVDNASDLDGDVLTYTFELDRVNTFDGPDRQSSGEIDEGQDQTSWTVSDLVDNTQYHWRAKASDGAAESGWTQGSFFVNVQNDAPPTPVLLNPGNEAWVSTLTPTLEVHPVEDPDHDAVTYRFEVFANPALTQLVAEGQSTVSNWLLPSALSDNTWYHWRVRAVDEYGLASDWMDAGSFYTDSNGINDQPEIDILEPAQDVLTNAAAVPLTWADSDPDSGALISLYHDSDNSGSDGAMIVADIPEDPDAENDSYEWDISSLPDGLYYVYAVISDETSSAVAYSTGAITIDRTPAQVATSLPGGTYEGPQSVELTSDETADIHYTLDGSDPSVDTALYQTAIDITESLTLRYMTVDLAGNVSAIVTQVYTITELPPEDTDGDGIVDADEDVNQNGVVDPGETDPNDPDTDHDGVWDGVDSCPVDGGKTDPGVCGCGVADTDTDGDGTADCNDGCIDDPFKVEPGACGCNVPDVDSDNDGLADCHENVPNTVADNYVMDEDDVLVVGAFDGVLTNDSDGDGDSLTASIGSEPVHGNLTLGQDGSFTYSPFENFNGEDIFTYIANDGLFSSEAAQVTITVNPVNDAPVVNAGPDQADVSLGDISLTGVCTDVDGDQIDYSWEVVSEPYSGAGQLSDAFSLTPTLTINGYGSYEIQLQGCDSDVCASDEVTIATEENLPPTADAGADFSAPLNQMVCLNGSGSDPNDDPIAFSWVIQAPDGSDVIPDGTDTPQPCFYADQIGIYSAMLTVNDGYSDSPQDVVEIHIEGNADPVANAGADQEAEINQEVCVSGVGSSDPDGDDLSFSWTLIGKPDASTLEIAADEDGLCFTPDAAGEYVLQLIVTDTHGNQSEPDTATITVSEDAATVDGDLDGDSDIDMNDYTIFRSTLGRCSGDGGYIAEADYDGDGCITYLDYRIWYGYFRAQ